MPSNSITPPRISLPDDRKDEAYHKQWLQAILNNSVASGFFPTMYQAMDVSYRFYNGVVDTGENWGFLQQTTDGKQYPAVWMNYNGIKNKVDLLVGELGQRGFEMSIKTVNKDAQTRKMKFENEVWAESVIRDLFMAGVLEQVEEAPIGFSDEAKMNDSDLNLFLKTKYKEKYEIVMERIVRYDIERLRYMNATRKTLFRDMLIAGRCVTKEDYYGGMPIFRRIDPRYLIIDPMCNDDFFSDANYVAEYRYMNLSEAADRYGLTLEEIQDAQTNAAELLVWFGYNYNGLSFLNPFITENGQLKCLVVYAEWRDIKQVKYKKAIDKYGTEHWKQITDKKDEKISAKEKELGYSISTKNIQTIRRSTLVGGKFIKEWGEMPNQPRSVDTPEFSAFSYTVVAPNSANYMNTSLTQGIEPLQQFKDLIMYTIQQRMSVAMGKGLMYDLKYLPDGFSEEDVMYYLKANGFAFYNSGKEEIPPGGQPFQSVDATLSQDVNLYLMLAQYVDNQMNMITGINESRQGFTKASQLVGVTQQNLMQSSLITEPYFAAFMEFEKITLQRHADTVKTVWKYVQPKYEAVVGDVFSKMLEEEKDNFYLQDYGLFTEVEPQMLQNRNSLNQMVMGAVQAGQLDMVKALVLLTEPDTKIAVYKFAELVERENMAKQQQEAQMMQMQQQGNMQTEQMIGERELATIEKQNEGAIAKKMVDIDGRKELQAQKLLAGQSVERNKQIFETLRGRGK